MKAKQSREIVLAALFVLKKTSVSAINAYRQVAIFNI
jgi:hypothetical protein